MRRASPSLPNDHGAFGPHCPSIATAPQVRGGSERQASCARLGSHHRVTRHRQLKQLAPQPTWTPVRRSLSMALGERRRKHRQGWARHRVQRPPIGQRSKDGLRRYLSRPMRRKAGQTWVTPRRLHLDSLRRYAHWPGCRSSAFTLTSRDFVRVGSRPMSSISSARLDGDSYRGRPILLSRTTGTVPMRVRRRVSAARRTSWWRMNDYLSRSRSGSSVLSGH